MSAPLVPPPPPDPVLADRIVKVAVNVASNGQKFEHFVMEKESANPDFDFLRGGLYSEFYEHIKNLEIVKLNQNKAFARNNPPVAAKPAEINIENLRSKILELKKQVAESQFNVDQQRIVLSTIDEVRIMETYLQAEKAKMDKFIADNGLDLTGLDKILSSNSWSQSNVAQGKNWILDHCSTDRQREVVMMYLHYRVRTAPLDSAMRLLVLYIADDLAAYCHKKLPPLTTAIGRYVPKFYAYACESKIEGVKDKCAKLLRYWEKGYPFDDKCLKYVKEPEKTLQSEQTMRTAEINAIKAKFERENKYTLNGYEKQHQTYASHLNAQIAALENTITNEIRKKALANAEDLVPAVPYYNLPAGVIINMIKKEDFTYKPIEVEKIRLPNVGHVSERLQGQMTRFYMTIPDAMLDENGWENGGLDSYYQLKAQARKQMEEACVTESKKIEDMFINKYRSPSPEARELHKAREEEKKERKRADTNPFAYSYDDRPAASSDARKRSRTPDSSPEYSRSGFGGGGGGSAAGSSRPTRYGESSSLTQPIAFSSSRKQ